MTNRKKLGFDKNDSEGVWIWAKYDTKVYGF